MSEFKWLKEVVRQAEENLKNSNDWRKDIPYSFAYENRKNK
jgi:hypothetical protein